MAPDAYVWDAGDRTRELLKIMQCGGRMGQMGLLGLSETAED